MSNFSLSDIVANLLPAILAGVIGGFGAYVAVKVDVAVLLSNQSALIEQGKKGHEMLSRHDNEISLLKYQVDVLEGNFKEVKSTIAKR